MYLKPLSIGLVALGNLAFFQLACREVTATNAPVTETATQSAKQVIEAMNQLQNNESAVAASTSSGPTTATSDDEALFNTLMARAKAENLHTKPFGDIMVEVGKWFMEKPYVGGQLDKDTSQEKLVVTFNQFDCLLLVETTYALALNIAKQDAAFASFQNNLRSIRYRQGKQEYCERLHYFTDWIVENQQKGRVKDVTKEVGKATAIKQTNANINFMTTHRNSYPQLIGNDDFYRRIQQSEQNLNTHQFFYIPKDQIRKAYGWIKTGDIIATATNISGLDVTHTGLAVALTGGKVGFLNASSSAKKVIISPDLQDYSMGIKAQIGILVIRPVAP